MIHTSVNDRCICNTLERTEQQPVIPWPCRVVSQVVELDGRGGCARVSTSVVRELVLAAGHIPSAFSSMMTKSSLLSEPELLYEKYDYLFTTWGC